MWTIIIIAVIAWFAFSHFKKKKYEAEAKRWSVDFRNDPSVKKVKSRLRWKDLP